LAALESQFVRSLENLQTITIQITKHGTIVHCTCNKEINYIPVWQRLEIRPGIKNFTAEFVVKYE
jgi:hypothetical protein